MSYGFCWLRYKESNYETFYQMETNLRPFLYSFNSNIRHRLLCGRIINQPHCYQDSTTCRLRFPFGAGAYLFGVTPRLSARPIHHSI